MNEDITELSKHEFSGTAMILSRVIPEIYAKMNMLDMLRLYHNRVDIINQYERAREALTPFDNWTWI